MKKFEKIKVSISEYLPDMAKAITDAVEGGLIALQDGAEWLTRDKAIIEDARERGFEVEQLSDLGDGANL